MKHGGEGWRKMGDQEMSTTEVRALPQRSPRRVSVSHHSFAKPMAPIGSFPLLHILLHRPHDRRTFLVYWDDEWWKIWMISIENFYTPLNLTHLSHFVLIASNYEAPTVDQDLILWRWSLIPFILCSLSQA